jgi:threonine/homoserine/homoserine lactone efflux protein
MNGTAWFAASFGFALVSSITPGPNNMMLLASGLNFGFRRTVPHIIGVNLGFCAMLVLVGLGFAQVFDAFPWLYGVLRYAGAAYLLFLAYSLARSDRIADTARPGARPLWFIEAAAFQWVNPKAWMMILGAIAAYVPRENFAPNLLLMAAVFLTANLPSIALWAGFGSSLRRFLGTPGRLRAFNLTMAAALAASLYPILAE